MQVCCTKIGICSPYFHKNLRYEISWKCVQWKPRWYMRTDGRTDDLTVWYHFTRRECFYGGLTLPAVVTCTSNFLQNSWYFLPIFKKFEFSPQFFVVAPNTKCHRNRPIGSRAETSGQTNGRKEGQTDRETKFMTKVVGYFSDHANTPKNERPLWKILLSSPAACLSVCLPVCLSACDKIRQPKLLNFSRV